MPYFRARTLDELRDQAAEQGAAIALDDELTPLFEPIRIGGRTAASRMAVHPMEGCDGNADGTPGELTRRRWRRFAEGGAALIWGEATAVVPEGRANPRQLLITPQTLPALRRLLAETRAARRAAFGSLDGFIVGLQLTHSGRWSHGGPVIAQHGQAIDAIRRCEARPVISDDDLQRLEERFVEAAVLAHEAGFDFVDVKQCHTYLINELLGARTRPGRYGGDYESRTRFIRNVFAGIRARLGENIVLATRLNAFDGVPYAGQRGVGAPAPHERPYLAAWGTDVYDPTQPDLSEPLRLVGDLRALGLQLLNVSMGSPYFNPHLGRPFERAPVDGYAPPEHPIAGVARHVALTGQIQRAYPDLPVIGTGYSWLRHFALHAGAANVRARAVSLVGLGRGALAYPDFARDALARGALDPNKACIGVSYCTALMRAKHNEHGQYATGCVPRDRLYAEALKQARVSEGWS